MRLEIMRKVRLCVDLSFALYGSIPAEVELGYKVKSERLSGCSCRAAEYLWVLAMCFVSIEEHLRKQKSYMTRTIVPQMILIDSGSLTPLRTQKF